LHKLFDVIKEEHLAVKVKAYNKDYLGAAEKLFEMVKNLVDEREGKGKGYDNQFKGFKAFKYRIKFEAILGLAYINYIKGLGRRAEKNYEEAQGIINDKHLTGNKDYLQSILLINRERNGLDNRIERRKSSPKNSKSSPIEDFRQTLEIYEKT
jgi:hypothetical protein